MHFDLVADRREGPLYGESMLVETASIEEIDAISRVCLLVFSGKPSGNQERQGKHRSAEKNTHDGKVDKGVDGSEAAE